MKATKKSRKNTQPATTKYFKDMITRKIYEVPPSKIREYGFYRNRYTVPIMLGILLNNFQPFNEVTLIITVGLLIVLEFRYRKAFLPSLNVRHHVNVDKDVKKEAIIMNSILYIILAILLLVYGYTGDVADNFKWILLALGVGSGGLSFMYLSELLAVK